MRNYYTRIEPRHRQANKAMFVTGITIARSLYRYIENGVATLTGTLESLAEEEAAIFIARKASARFVADELVIRNPFSQAEATQARG